MASYLDDPMVMLGMGLIGGTSPNFGQNAMQAMLFQKQMLEQQRRQKLADEQEQTMKLENEQRRRAMEQQAKLDALGPQFMRGNAGEQGPQQPGMDWGGYANALAGIDPMKALALQSQLAQTNAKQQPKYHVVGGALVPEPSAPGQQAAPVYQAPETPKTREIKSGDKILTYELQNGKWVKIAEAPAFKPEKPDKPAAPQLYNGPNGPVWVTPPDRGGAATVPVTGPDGKPLPAAKREHPLTESQARGTLFLGQMRAAEDAIKTAKVDPTSLRGQADIAMANRANEYPLLGPGFNAMASSGAQQYNQAAEQWAEAFLRIKTGAASTRDEVIRNVRTFFPQPFDSPQVVKQKNEARAAATKQMEILASQGVGQLDAQAKGNTGGWSIRPIGE